MGRARCRFEARADAGREIASDDAARRRMAALGRERVQHMTYREAARTVLDVLRKAVHGGVVEAPA